ncbi:hypothetical protein ACFUCQ_22920 [Streptomyces sp. NPDC057197]|uniref:hypothetical protein n=1 Tax=unclassified Streptomyces TaxID=2593676 RepID=UPI0007DD00AD|nr:hypothetical protein [Streptomyces sp. SAT1]ANH94614.1 hypothetical protein A8713_28395 [Streptomyces sp. SAT1]
MELRSVEELMDLLHAGRGAARVPDRPGRRTDPCAHALRTAALLRRGRPADKELQIAGLVLAVGGLLGPGEGSDEGGSEGGGSGTGALSGALRAADAVRGLLGERVFRLLRQQAYAADGRPVRPVDEDALALRLAAEEARTPGGGDGAAAGVLEDWRTVLELVAARNSRLGAVD